jgi:anaerobic magnesium-protoporphyrin IX monomethyl ester cyclase
VNVNAAKSRVLLVDLNNFARYPTLSIGYLVAALRRASFDVEVLCPLNHGVHPAVRERPEGRRSHIERRAYFATHRAAAPFHETLRAARKRAEHRAHPRVIKEVQRSLDERPPDVLLLSAYLDHYPSVHALAGMAATKNIPVLLGGPMFNLPDVAREWVDIPGLSAVVGGEVDLSLDAIVGTVLDGGDMTQHPGVFMPGGREAPPAPPLDDLSLLPTPDFSDFPWNRYPDKVIPLMTGRGCAWGRCLFCSDVITANGRTFRSRPVEAVLDELEEQSERYGTRDFICLDIKLNSNLETWRGLIDGFQDRVPGGRWIGTVHAQARGDNGLTATDLHAARAAGLTRMSFGLETGSQRVNDSMAKGTALEHTSQFLRDAHRAGISLRTTMMLGYPGETAQDVNETVRFVRDHENHLDRIQMNLFKATPGTRFNDQFDRHPERYEALTHLRWNPRLARASYRNRLTADSDYRRAKRELLGLVHQINRRPLREHAVVFDGLM